MTTPFAICERKGVASPSKERERVSIFFFVFDASFAGVIEER